MFRLLSVASIVLILDHNKLCAWRHNMPLPLSSRRRAPPSRHNVAVLSHAEYVPTLTAADALTYVLWPR